MRRIWLVLPLSILGCGRASPGDSPDATGVEIDAANGPDGTIIESSRVYGHSGTVLYRIDTGDLEVVEVGSFGAALGTQSMTDIAINKDERMIGVTLDRIFEINADTGTATFLADFQGTGNLTSLSFVPLDPEDAGSAERLVTAGDQGDVYEVNPDTGETLLLGNYGLHDGVQIVSSGDIVSVHGFGTLATVDVTDDFNDPDYLAWIDTETWVATPIGNVGTSHDRIFGLGFWGGTIFGFVDDGAGAGTGQFVTIDSVTGTSTPATNQSFRWYGAGVTTVAPIVD